MNKLEQAIQTLHEVDNEAGERSRKSSIHPASRLIVSIVFILVVVSFHKYDVLGTFSMFLYLIMLGIMEDISLKQGLRRVRYIIGIVCILGIVNPFFDRGIITHVGHIAVSGGVLSMVTLFMKGVLTVYSAYFLIMTTGMENICVALRSLGVPKGGVTVVLLIYRYIIVLLKEVQRLNEAYKLRAPGQKGIHIKAWGSFVGLLLLRSMDRAENVYDSMQLRGYQGEFSCELVREKGKISKTASILYTIFWIAVFVILRFVPIFQIVGSMAG